MPRYISSRPVAIALPSGCPLEELTGEPILVHCPETGESGHFLATLHFSENEELGLVASIGGFGHTIENDSGDVGFIPMSRIQYLTQAGVDAIVFEGVGNGMLFGAALISPALFEEKNGRLEYRGDDIIEIYKPLS